MPVYVLELEDGYWYIGRTDNVAQRIKSHWEGKGSAWTRLHRPLRLSAQYATISSWQESQTTEFYMLLHGIDKVRGAEYTQVVLPDFQVKALHVKLAHLLDVCYRCGKKGHYAKHHHRDDQSYSRFTILLAVFIAACIIIFLF